MKIKQLQAGGYINYQPIPMVPQSQPADPQQQATAPQEDEGYLDKEILGKMLGKGITTDVMQYSQQLQSAYQQYQTMNDLQRNSYKGRQIRSMLKGDLGQLNALMRAKDTFDDSLKNIKSKDGLDEFAVTNSGVVAQNQETGKIDSVTFTEFAKNKDKYRALTNAELAQQREYNNDLVKNSNVFSILNFGTGMSEVKKEVYLVAGHIGKSSESNASGMFQSNDAQDIKDLTAAAKAGAFKIKSGESNTTNLPQLKSAMETMWRNLSPSAKAVLKARAVAEGAGPADIESTAKTMAASLLAPEAETSHSVTYDESMRGGSKGASGAAEKMADFGTYTGAFYMRNPQPLTQIGPKGVKIDGFASVLPAPSYTDKDNLRGPLRNSARLNNISYLSQAFTANGDKVDPDNTVITGDAYVTELPVVKDDNGNYQIDEEGAKRYAQYQEAKQQTNEGKITPAQDAELRAKFGTIGLTIKKLVVAEASSFDTKTFFSDRDKGYYDELSSDERRKLGEIVDPDHATVHHSLWTMNDAHKHLIFLPAKSEAFFGEMDGQKGRVPDTVYDVRNGYGGNNDSANYQGVSIDKPNAQAMGLTKDFLK